jgi:orotate phosphoribosyltransferase-like protein
MFGTKKFFVTATGTPTTKATEGTPTTGHRFLVTDIAGSSDSTTAVLKVIEDTEGTPITLWQIQIGAGNYSHRFKTPLQVTVDKSVGVEISGTPVSSLYTANIAGEITSH